MIQELLGQTNFIGKDGFYWWVGQIETEKGSQPKPNDDRYKVRIVGQHLKDCNAVSYDDLPWAIVMMPATAPRREGNTDFQSVKYKSGDWVLGFFLDGRDGQQPVIMGSIGQQTAATKDVGKQKPEGQCLSFTTFMDPDVNVNTNVPQDKKNSIKEGGVTGTQGGTNPSGTPTDLRGAVNASNETASTALLGTKCCNNDMNPAGEFFCVEVSDAKCEDTEKDKTRFEQVLTELFGNISSSGGNFGTQLVSKYTGKLYDYIGIGQGYINKITRLSSSLVARIKGEIFALIKQGAKQILTFLLTTEVIDPTQPETFVGPYANPGQAVRPAKKRVGRLRGITKWINDQLKKINCVMDDLDQRLMDFLTDLIFGYLQQVINGAACLIDSIIGDILDQILSFLSGILSSILGPLQQLLSIIADPLNIIGAALAMLFDLLGISCGGSENKCASKEQTTNCSGNCGKQEDDDFLDRLIEGIENGNLDNTKGTCAEAYQQPSRPKTKVRIVGGVPNPDGFTSETPVTLPPDDTTDDDIDRAIFPPTDDGTPTDNPGQTTPDNLTPDTNPPSNNPVTSPTLDNLNDVNVLHNGSLNITVGGGFSAVTFVDRNTSVTPSILTTSVAYNGNLNVVVRDDNSFVFLPVNVSPESITYSLSVDKTRVEEGDSIKFTLVANGGVIPNGTVFNYVMFGTITSSDFFDNTTIGTMVMNNNIATKIVNISEDTEIEGDEVVTFNVLEAAVAIPFTIIGQEVSAEVIQTVPSFTPPVLGDPEVCDDGRVMHIPIIETGDRYKVPPIVVISGDGFGASAKAELNEEGYIKNITILRSGFGYLPSRVNNNCVIDKIIVNSPGIGYYSTPTVYVNGESGVANARVDERGFVYAIEVINGTKLYSCTPKVEIFGGDGLGASAVAIMSCRSDELHKLYVNVVAPSGVDEVVDCP